jgi:hypothetical protein
LTTAVVLLSSWRSIVSNLLKKETRGELTSMSESIKKGIRGDLTDSYVENKTGARHRTPLRKVT